MGNVQTLRQPPPARSPVREQLAAAIDRKKALSERLARINEASEVKFVWDAQEKVEKAEQALAKAREEEPRRVVAGLVGDPSPSGPSAEQARWLLEEAQDGLKLAQATRDALDDQRREAERGLESAIFTLRDALRKVVQSEGAANKLLAELEAARREVARLHGILSLLSARNCLSPYWDSIHPFPPSQAEQTWREALTALEADADAALPA